MKYCLVLEKILIHFCFKFLQLLLFQILLLKGDKRQLLFETRLSSLILTLISGWRRHHTGCCLQSCTVQWRIQRSCNRGFWLQLLHHTVPGRPGQTQYRKELFIYYNHFISGFGYRFCKPHPSCGSNRCIWCDRSWIWSTIHTAGIRLVFTRCLLFHNYYKCLYSFFIYL